MSSDVTLHLMEDAVPSYMKQATTPKNVVPFRVNKKSVVHQVEAAFQSPAIFLGGAVLGGAVPAISFEIVHFELKPEFSMLYVVAAACLIYSSCSVFDWAKRAFKHSVKAGAWVVLMELAMVFSHSFWVTVPILAILVTINAIAAGSNLANDYRSKV